ncbi:SIMPL domain-containing protein [Thauera sp. CAU 1555]|uniref:SIMPL domain-containing protein n=1 Tax=Thauera sedimentorum TaxID=2767595 RepID=A0ABR9B8T0_9RHOO|nr:SIMPL domain-containing protein [Thauera sedimentorum]MBC9071667.1 SIMPL domain-containing protein [Thauera sedimentorum]MBD8502586.1 SIMPL domain-containing protein [Thauera sedimentorum]
MLPTSRYLTALFLAGALIAGHASAEEAVATRSTTIDLNAEALRAAPNDLAVATAYIEITDISPAAVARDVNKVIAAALDTAGRYDQVKTQSGNTQTWPVYGKNGRQIEGWRMRSELRLESRDVAAMSELLGKLQATMAVSQIGMEPAPETRRKALDEATVDAIRAFEQRAKLVSATLGKSYRIRHLGIGESGFRPQPMPRMRAAVMSAEAAPAPLEAGESEVGVSVSGTIELLD